jgi:hypothetical protein
MNNTGHWKEHYLVYQTFLSIGVNLAKRSNFKATQKRVKIHQIKN